MNTNAQVILGLFGMLVSGLGFFKVLSYKPKPVEEKEKEIFK